jgi:hypothetical protein
MPEGEEQEQNDEHPFEIATPDHFLDTITDGGIDFGDRIEKVVIVMDRLGRG